jgi:hypothetical protein
MDNEEDNVEVKVETPEQETQEQPSLASEVIDMVMDGNASDAKDAIYGLLYQKVGERVDSLKADARVNKWSAEETPSESEPEQN